MIMHYTIADAETVQQTPLFEKLRCQGSDLSSRNETGIYKLEHAVRAGDQKLHIAFSDCGHTSRYGLHSFRKE